MIRGSRNRIALPPPPVVPRPPKPRYEVPRYDPVRYTIERLGWTPWAGTPEQPGQVEIMQAYAEALRQQIEHPDQPVRNYLRIEAGHTVGKTKMLSAIASHFFDAFPNGVGYCFAPSYDQINDLLFKEIRADRRARKLPGRVLDTPELKDDNGDHFIKGRATNNAHGNGSEHIQGQHQPFSLFILDEAEGIPEYVYDAVDSMASGGVSVVIMAANPRTRASTFHKRAEHPQVQNFRISCLWHPNVLSGRELVPGAVKRRWIDSMLLDPTGQHVTRVTEHNPDAYTFEVPWRPGVIYKPRPRFLFRVLGIAPRDYEDDAMVSLGRYEAAVERGRGYPALEDAFAADWTSETEVLGEPLGASARIGVDMARMGADRGTVWLHWGRAVWLVAQLFHRDTGAYMRAIEGVAEQLAARGVTSLRVRVDGGGGYGAGVIDGLRASEDLDRLFADFRVSEVHFGGVPFEDEIYADLASEMYGALNDQLLGLAIIDPPATLEADLCERRVDHVLLRKVEVKKLEPKEKYKARTKRSPDDGDGCVLATAPDFLFREELQIFL